MTKPSGSREVFIITLEDANTEGEGQETLCGSGGMGMGIYGVCRLGPFPRLSMATNEMTMNSNTCRLPRSRGMTSFARVMASAKSDGFPLVDREFDSDSDTDTDTDEEPEHHHTSSGPARLEVIPEADEGEEPSIIADYTAPRLCHDPYSTAHPICLCRTESASQAHAVADAQLDFRYRFATTHEGEDSAAHYHNWRALKWEFGESFVYGGSGLSTEVIVDDGEGVIQGGHEGKGEKLLRMIEKKYGSLTLQGQQGEREAIGMGMGSEEAEWKERVEKFLEDGVEGDADEGLVSEPSTLFEGVEDLEDGTEAGMMKVPSRSGAVISMSEEVFLKVSCLSLLDSTYADSMQILNMSHDEFVEHYIQRQQARIAQAALVNQNVNDSEPSGDIADAHESSVNAIEQSLVEAASEPTNLPALPAYQTALSMVTRPENALSSHLPSHTSSDSLFAQPSIFSNNPSVTTKPSNESFLPDYPQIVKMLDSEADVDMQQSSGAEDEREASMSSPMLLTSKFDATTPSVSALEERIQAHQADSTPTKATGCKTQVGSARDGDGARDDPWADVCDLTNGQTPSQKQQPAQNALVPDDARRISTLYSWRMKAVARAKRKLSAVCGATKSRVLRSAKKLGAAMRSLAPESEGDRSL